MSQKLTGWSCKKCNRTAPFGQFRLYCFDRLCPKCAKESPPEPTPTTQRVNVEGFVVAVRRLVAYWFGSFHLNPCGQCDHPTWQQPCWWCRYYPMGERAVKKPLGKEHWDREMQEAPLVLHYIACRFGNGACPYVNNHWLDKALEAAKVVQWPTGDEIWEAFGPDADKDAREQLHPWKNPELFRKLDDERERGEIEFAEWQLALPYGTIPDSERSGAYNMLEHHRRRLNRHG